MRYSVRRMRYITILCLVLVGLATLVMPKMPSAASSTKQVQSKLSSAVNKARNALARARAKQQAHPDSETARAATEAFKAYRAAVDDRCTEIEARFIELANLRKQVGDTDAMESEQAALEEEFRELKNSLIENQQIQPETLGAKKSPIPSALIGSILQCISNNDQCIRNSEPRIHRPSQYRDKQD